MSRETLEDHWGKQHRGYVENLNKQIVGTELDGMALEDIVTITYNKGDLLPAFNNAAQVVMICFWFALIISLWCLEKDLKFAKYIFLLKNLESISMKFFCKYFLDLLILKTVTCFVINLTWSFTNIFEDQILIVVKISSNMTK